MEAFMFILSSMWMPLSINIMIERKIGVKRRIICGLLEMIAYLCIMSVNCTEISALIYFPVCFLVVYFGMGKSKLLLLTVPLSYMLVLLCSYGMSLIIAVLDITDIYADLKVFALDAGGITVAVLFFSYVLKIIYKFYKKHIQVIISKEIALLLVFNLVLCTVVYLVNSWSFREMGRSFELDMISRSIFFSYAVLTISITIFTLRIVRSQEEMKREKEERRNLLEYTSQVESMYEELRSFKHDYVNILASLSGYIENGDMEGLEQYFEQSILPTNEKINQGKYHLQKLSKIQEPAIKGLVSSKMIYAMNAGLEVFIDIVEDVEDIAIRTLDLTRILGIYIDNAIEATSECEKKELKFNIVKEENAVIIVVMNSFVNHNLSVKEMEKQNVSTKGEGRGLGLNNVNEILRKYSNINKITEIKDGYFVQTLVIYNKNVKGK